MAPRGKSKALAHVGDEEEPSEKDALALREALAAQGQPHLRGSRWPVEVVDRALLELALLGGNANRASLALREMGLPVSAESLRRWSRGRYRARYEELGSTKADELREKVARDSLEFAQRAQSVKEQALERVGSGLASADAVEASMILRNVAAAEQSALANEAQLRGRAGIKVEVTGLDDLLGRLARVGIAEIVDAEVVEEEEDHSPSSPSSVRT
jgi:hypothetical protein